MRMLLLLDAVYGVRVGDAEYPVDREAIVEQFCVPSAAARRDERESMIGRNLCPDVDDGGGLFCVMVDSAVDRPGSRSSVREYGSSNWTL